jgi:hypothetical protein
MGGYRVKIENNYTNAHPKITENFYLNKAMKIFLHEGVYGG